MCVENFFVRRRDLRGGDALRRFGFFLVLGRFSYNSCAKIAKYGIGFTKREFRMAVSAIWPCCTGISTKIVPKTPEDASHAETAAKPQK